VRHHIIERERGHARAAAIATIDPYRRRAMPPERTATWRAAGSLVAAPAAFFAAA
jgi:hypothetical protein